MNKVILLGRLTDEPTNYSKDDKYMAKFTIAVDRKYKTEGQASADFISCVVFGKTAEFINKYFRKGMRIGINGRIQTGTYTDKDNVKHYTTDVIVEEVEFVESKKAADNQGAETTDGWQEIPEGIENSLPFK